jgi:hypothetical protein
MPRLIVSLDPDPPTVQRKVPTKLAEATDMPSSDSEEEPGQGEVNSPDKTLPMMKRLEGLREEASTVACTACFDTEHSQCIIN